MKTTHTSRRRLAVGAIAAGLLLAACGGGDDANSATPVVVAADGAAPDDGDAPDDDATADAATASDEELALQFAACMRDEGIDWPDPITEADGSIDLFGGQAPASIAADASDEVIEAAAETCGPIIEGASFLPGAGGIDEETQDLLLDFAQCLRDEGIDADDPDLDVLTGGGSPAALFGDGFDPLDPATQDAIGVCQNLFAGGIGSQGG